MLGGVSPPPLTSFRNLCPYIFKCDMFSLVLSSTDVFRIVSYGSATTEISVLVWFLGQIVSAM